ncbi:hypothetical protein T484DRAFT_2310355 [Baffinella frigidus]|nr:hypothetical protein T484DRAFT_2310355 [Cryptophyta sp. CCMP2293]
MQDSAGWDSGWASGGGGMKERSDEDALVRARFLAMQGNSRPASPQMKADARARRGSGSMAATLHAQHAQVGRVPGSASSSSHAFQDSGGGDHGWASGGGGMKERADQDALVRARFLAMQANAGAHRSGNSHHSHQPGSRMGAASSPSSQGGASLHRQGSASPYHQGGASRESQGGASPYRQGDASPYRQGDASPCRQGGASPHHQGGASPQLQGGASRESPHHQGQPAPMEKARLAQEKGQQNGHSPQSQESPPPTLHHPSQGMGEMEPLRGGCRSPTSRGGQTLGDSISPLSVTFSGTP